MTGFRVLNLRHFSQHRLRSALTIMGVAVAAALIVTVFALYGSLSGSIRQLAASVAGGADLEVAGITDAGFDQRLLAEVEATDGVGAAVPLIRSSVIIGGRRALLFGLDERARALGGQLERESASRRDQLRAHPDGLLLGEGVARAVGATAGQRVRVYSGTGGERVVLALDVLTGERAGEINHGFFAAAALPLAQQITGKQGRLDSVLVVADSGVDGGRLERRLSEVVGQRAVVSSPYLRVEQATAATSLFQNTTLLVAFMALVVAGLLVFNTLSVVALERRQQFATLRALGGTRRGILRGFLGEAALLGLAGAAIGCLLGVLTARSLVQQLPSYLVSAFDVQVGFVLPPYAIPLAVVACLATSLVAAALPARRAMVVQPVEAMRPLGVLETHNGARRRTAVALAAGVALAGAGLAGALTLRDERSLAAGPLLLLGSIVVIYGLTATITRAAGWLAARFGASGRLAAAAVERAPRRIWTTTVIVAIAGAIAVSTQGATQNQVSTVAAKVASLADVDFFVQTVPADDLPTGPLLPRGWRSELETVPGVAEVVEGQLAYATVGRQRVVLQGFGGSSNAPVFRLADAAAQAALLDGSGAVVSRRVASRLGLGVGDTVRLPTPRGEQRLPIADVVDAVVTAEGGLIAMSLEHLQTWFGRPGASYLEVTLDPGAQAGPVRERIEELAGRAPLPVHVVSGAESLRSTEGAVRQAAALALTIQWVVAGAAALAVLTTLMISVVERRRELGIIRAVGASRRLLGWTVLREAAAVGTLGGAIGLVVGIALHYVAVQALSQAAGLGLDFEFTPVALAAAVAAFGASMLGAIGPARRAARLNVIEAIGYE